MTDPRSPRLQRPRRNWTFTPPTDAELGSLSWTTRLRGRWTFLDAVLLDPSQLRDDAPRPSDLNRRKK